MKKEIWIITIGLLVALAAALTAPACGDDDGGGDGDTDTDSDTDSDTDTDADTDSDSDTDTDTDSDSDTDTDTDTDTDCTDLGGTCVEMPWDLCAAGFEPYAMDDPLGCNARCCVPATGDYSCNESTDYEDCIPSAACTGCWAASSGGHACEEGRSCCTYICD